MEINKKQAMLLIEVSKQDGKRSMSEVGKKVYDTNVTVYNNMYILRDMGFVYLVRMKNKIIPTLTKLGKEYAEANKDIAN